MCITCVIHRMFSPILYIYSQHDSQELLRFLLSGLHDELNTAQSAKYVYSPLPAHPTLVDRSTCTTTCTYTVIWGVFMLDKFRFC